MELNLSQSQCGHTYPWQPGVWERVLGNRIGTNRTGSAALGNQTQGIYISGGSRNTIGGNASGAGNLISGNLYDGVNITDARFNKLFGNKIGTDVNGTAAIPNISDGIYLSNARDTSSGICGGRGQSDLRQ